MNFDDVKVTKADQRLGGIFKDKRICAEALQMRGPVSLVVVSGACQKIESNKRLSILGDAVLTNSLCNIWYASQDNKGLYHSKLTHTHTDDSQGAPSLRMCGPRYAISSWVTIVLHDAGK